MPSETSGDTAEGTAGGMYDASAWYRAISMRRSVRAFTRDPVPEEALARIAALCDGFSPLCAGARAHIMRDVRDDAPSLFTGFLGSIGKIQGPPCAVAFAVDASVPRHLEAAGYLGEGIVLEATAAGLGTCWVAGTFSRTGVLKRLALDPGWSIAGCGIAAITPLGYEDRGARGSVRMIKALSGFHDRKSLEGIASGLPREKWPHDLDRILEAARWAPSAVNRQPWRFSVDERGVTLAADAAPLSPGSIKRVDCGIAMLHFQVAAQVLGTRGEWRFVDEPAVARFDYA
jgi:nitroreductase